MNTYTRECTCACAHTRLYISEDLQLEAAAFEIVGTNTSLSQAGFICEAETTVERPPPSDWPAGKSWGALS